MYETAVALTGALRQSYAITLAMASAILVLAGAARVMKRGDGTTPIPTFGRIPPLIWEWPIYLWGLETAIGILLGIESWHAIVNGQALRTTRQLYFCSLYALVLVGAGTWATRRLIGGSSDRARERGRVGRSLGATVMAVLAVETGVLLALARTAW